MITLREIFEIFPKAKIIDKSEPETVRKRCIICGAPHLGWPESQYCSNECVVAGHRKHDNPSKERVRSLRNQCRAGYERMRDRVAPGESFETWLRNFEAFIERTRGQQQNDNQQEDNPMSVLDDKSPGVISPAQPFPRSLDSGSLTSGVEQILTHHELRTNH
jgi:hypothetical protein